MAVFDDQFLCSDDMELFAVAQKIKAIHGGAVPGQLRLWLNSVEPNCIVRHFGQTLREAFMLDSKIELPVPADSDGSQTAQVTVYYDFDPLGENCALLNAHLTPINTAKSQKA
ncbi:hypothetical protein TRVL_02299 [Trypanosoma vivax]|nr:hypothetical protein TRVL_02299 [Trypanosoma vivax]